MEYLMSSIRVIGATRFFGKIVVRKVIKIRTEKCLVKNMKSYPFHRRHGNDSFRLFLIMPNIDSLFINLCGFLM